MRFFVVEYNKNLGRLDVAAGSFVAAVDRQHVEEATEDAKLARRMVALRRAPPPPTLVVAAGAAVEMAAVVAARRPPTAVVCT